MVTVGEHQHDDVGEPLQLGEEFRCGFVIHAMLHQEFQGWGPPAGLVQGAHLVQLVADQIGVRAMFQPGCRDDLVGVNIAREHIVQEAARRDLGNDILEEACDQFAL